MTHPNFGGKGIFSRLAENLYRRLEESDYKMVWGFPNNNSHYGFNKNLKWNDIAIQGMMSLQTNKINLSSLDANFINISKFDSTNATIFQNSLKLLKINKTAKYLNWRYFENPLSSYSVLISKENSAGIIYKKITSFSETGNFEIDIMELNCNNDIRTLENILHSILALEKDIVQFNIWDSLFSTNQTFLEKLGFRIGSPVTYLGAKSFSDSQLIYDYRNWDISMGYSDVF
jgi:hypothetical protein